MVKNRKTEASTKTNTQERIKELEDELSRTKYNKKTQHAIGLLKAKIAKLKDKQEKRASVKKVGLGFGIRKSGDATIVIIGFPSVGKSTLLNQLTNANSDVGAYDFTTLNVVPGLMEYNHAKIQMLDIPGIIGGASVGKGRGKEILSMIRNADLLLILLDAAKAKKHLNIIQKELYDSKIRTNQNQPDVKITKTMRGGIKIGATVKLKKLTRDMIKDILKEFGLMNVEIVIRTEIDVDQLIDVIGANRCYTKAAYVVNKIDMFEKEQIKELGRKIKPDLMISALDSTNIEELRQLIFNKLQFMRIFLKQPGKEADMKEPIIMKSGNTIHDVCVKLHKEFLDKFSFARIWGKSSRFPGQKLLSLQHKLQDKDVLEIHLD